MNMHKKEIVTPSSISNAGKQSLQDKPGQISEGVKRASNIFSRVKENNDRTL